VGTAAAVQNLDFEWDLVGNLKKRIDANQSNLTETFFYDNINRLDYSTRNSVTNLDMTYDALGNITNKSDVGTYTYHATKKHQVTSTSNGWTFAYDNNGNMTSGRGSTIEWTSYNYAKCIRKGTACSGTTTDWSSFSYTPDRQYWRQQSNYVSGGTATTIYVGGLLEKVTAGSVTDYRHMIRAGNSTIIVSRKSSGTNTVNYVTQDHLGSSSVITNSSGGVLVNTSFAAFGKRRGSNWSGNPTAGDWTAIAGTTRRGYTDHSMLDNLELIHMNGRVQDPALGRFASADPFITEPGNTQNYNRYSYVYNDPLRLTDPSGFGTYDCQESRGSAGCTPEGMEEVQVTASRICSAGCMAWRAVDLLYEQILTVASGEPVMDKNPIGEGVEPAKPSAGKPAGHDYRTQNRVCKRPLTKNEQRELIQRFTVPNAYTQGRPQSAGVNMVANSWGIPGGFVTTTFSADGLAGMNVTTPFHVLTGVVERSIRNTNNGAFMETHGYGGYGSLNLPSSSPYASMETGGIQIDVGEMLDSINNTIGPDIFDSVDRQATRYAVHHFAGC
jgi:RHS repeat-associated protein